MKKLAFVCAIAASALAATSRRDPSETNPCSNLDRHDAVFVGRVSGPDMSSGCVSCPVVFEVEEALLPLQS